MKRFETPRTVGMMHCSERSIARVKYARLINWYFRTYHFSNIYHYAQRAPRLSRRFQCNLIVIFASRPRYSCKRLLTMRRDLRVRDVSRFNDTARLYMVIDEMKCTRVHVFRIGRFSQLRAGCILINDLTRVVSRVAPTWSCRVVISEKSRPPTAAERHRLSCRVASRSVWLVNTVVINLDIC